MSVATPEGREFPATGLDMSVSGMTFSCGGEVKVGDILKVSLFDFFYPTTVQAKVVRIDNTKRADRKRIAVVFQDISATEQLTIRNLFQNEAKKRPRA